MYENFDHELNTESNETNENKEIIIENPEIKTEPKPKKRKWPFNQTLTLALCCSLVGGVVGAGTVALGTNAFGSKNSSTILEGKREYTALNTNYVNTGEKMTASEIYAANVNATVGITTSINTNFFGYQTTSAASGSGFILTADGYIVTNYHVVEGASSIKVTTYDGTAYDATLIGYDESNDIAVLKVEASNLMPAVLGDSDHLNVGDDVVAIGNPLGELTFSLTSGAVSALNREVTMSNGISMDLIQTDCAINSGNSGGALFNMYGEVIGITNAKYSGSGSSGEASIDNIGFAIPMNSVKDIIESIIEKGYVSKPYIGVAVTDISTETQMYGLPQGAAVKSVTDGGPAQSAGLQENDIITAVNGTEITSSSELKRAVLAAAVGDKLTLSVYRQGETIEIEVTVGEQKQSAIQEDQNENNSTGYPWGNYSEH